MSAVDPAQRSRELGIVGEALYHEATAPQTERIGGRTVVRNMHGYLKTFCQLNLATQIVALGSVERRYGGIVAAGMSLLGARVPIQVGLTTSEVRWLTSHLVSRIRPKALTRLSNVGAWDQLSRGRPNHNTLRNLSPPKPHPGAQNKANIFADEVFSDLRRMSETLASDALRFAGYWPRLANDQLAALLLYGAGLAKHHPEPFRLATAALLMPDEFKKFSVILKSLGATALPLGACLVECNTMQGRSTGVCDLDVEIRNRTTAEIEKFVVDVDEQHLRDTVRRIFDEEMAETPAFKSLDAHWDSRWVWCVNGSHSSVLAAHRPELDVKKLPGESRVYRRAFVERIDDNPVTDWDGTTYVTPSQKLEHGKTRAIFACDTVSYLAFEHLLGPVTKVWRNRRTILDPGMGGTLGMCSRIRGLQAKYGSINVMIDFDAFNEQHTLQSQKIVIDELGRKTGYDAQLLSRLVDSFDKMYVVSGHGGLSKRVLGSLMSGHRGTSFLNTVLNAAYIRMSIGEERYSRIGSMHVGDDVYMAVPTYKTAVELMEAVTDAGFRTQPLKQSMGTHVAEFLRVALGPQNARGYFARSVSSAISGNWVNETKVSPLEGLSMMIQNARTLMNRSDNDRMSELTVSSVCRMTRIRRRTVQQLLAGTVAINDGPQFGFQTFRRIVRVYEKKGEDSRYLAIPVGARKATNAYQARHLAPIEREALSLVESGVSTAMLKSSYSKSFSDIDPDVLEKGVFHVREEVKYAPVGSVRLISVKGDWTGGLLSKYPVLNLLRGVLSERQLLTLLARVPYSTDLWSGVSGGRLATPFSLAWGRTYGGGIVAGAMSYSDASSAVRQTAADVVYPAIRCYV